MACFRSLYRPYNLSWAFKMNEYNLEFAKKLIEAADFISIDLNEIEAKRTVLYLSLLSCEISLKFVLDNAGYEISKIKSFNHRISQILDEITSKIELFREIAPGDKRWTPASIIRAKSINFGEAQSTVGAILTATETSKYPNEIRYGDNLYHYPPSVMLDTAKKVNEWAKDNQGKFRSKNIPTT